MEPGEIGELATSTDKIQSVHVDTANHTDGGFDKLNISRCRLVSSA